LALWSALLLLIWVKLGQEMQTEADKIVELPRRILAKQFAKDDFVLLYDSAKSFLTRVSEIVLLEAEGNDTVITLASGSKIMIRKTISKCEQRLDPSIFLRTDRSTMVNMGFVKKVEADAKRFLFILTNGKLVTVSRNRSINFRRQRSL
jgi:DNA-binding LytR/AlgR family response regulator